MRYLTVITLAAFMTLGCGGALKVPRLPDIKTTSDKDVRASIAYVYGVLHAFGDLLDASSQLEADATKAGIVPVAIDTQVKAMFVKIASQGKAIIHDIDTKALSDWKSIQDRVNPMLDDAVNLQSIAMKSGPSGWAQMLKVGIDIVLGMLSHPVILEPSPAV